MRVLSAIACSGLLISLIYVPVHAAPISYTLTTTASGTLGGSPFTDSSVMVRLTGDTTAIVAGTGTFAGLLENPGMATISVAGLGTATLTDSIVIVSSFNNPAYFGTSLVLILDNTNGTGILLQEGDGFLGYDLQTPLGPVSGTGGVASGSMVTPHFPTSAGDLTWAIGQPMVSSTFAAELVPEPGSLLLLVAGLAPLIAGRRVARR
jgi:hypothetical protein